MRPLRTALFTLSLSTLALGSLGCQSGTLTPTEALVGSAASALTVAEESGDVTADAVGAESPTALADQADLSASVPSAPSDAIGVCDLDAQRQRVLARYDADGNGVLDATELRALSEDVEARVGSPLAVRFGLGFRAHVVRRLHWLFDENGDGTLSSDERTAMVDALEARCVRIRAQVLATFDANGNGVLDPSERQAARDAVRARLEAARAAVLTKYDLDGDGVLEPVERLALRADRVAAFLVHRAAVIAEFDANHDGTLDAAEVKALKQALITRLIEGRDAA
jgi:Ca2+-binding EF-hand superfamily protein